MIAADGHNATTPMPPTIIAMAVRFITPSQWGMSY
jgi:hypothetical protein